MIDGKWTLLFMSKDGKTELDRLQSTNPPPEVFTDEEGIKWDRQTADKEALLATYRRRGDDPPIDPVLGHVLPQLPETEEPPVPIRRHLNKERRSLTHKFSVAGHKGYVTVGLYEDGKPGEMFVKMSKTGSTMSGMADSFATMTSLALQYGVPIKQLCRKFVGVRYEPQGKTPNPEIPEALSITDYIFRWLAFKFLSKEDRAEIGIKEA